MKLLSTGLELANLLITSDIMELLWNEISKRYEENRPHDPSFSDLVCYSHYDDEKQCTIVTFVAWPGSTTHQQLLEDADLVSSSSQIATESFALFEFLRGKGDFALNRAAITLFDRHRDRLYQLKDEIDHSKPIIVTGHSLGGAVASLFTLWLLESVNFSKTKTKTKRPICVTFGSPPIGDTALQKALSQYSPWNSCFLHVVSNQDPVTRKFINQDPIVYKPFGTFLLCSDSGCSCFEEPKTILELLAATASHGSADQGPDEGAIYGKIVGQLKRKVLFKSDLEADWATSPYAVGIATQLSVIEYKNENEHIKTVAERLEKQEKKFLIGRSTINPDKKLNEAKINMAKLEWYKKISKDRKIGYYDHYKNKRYMSDIKVEEIVKRLVNYWTDVVEEADKRPQKDGAALRTRWLFAGITYKRMVEPLCIAEYYHEKGLSNYEKEGRLKHFVRLEGLYSESDENVKSNKSSTIDEKRKNVSRILIEDSCFWARVEEAIKLLKKEESAEEKKTSMEKLKKFEEYVLVLLKKYEVSPEIFLEGSSFMQWWKEYKKAIGRSESSALAKFMADPKNKDYIKGNL